MCQLLETIQIIDGVLMNIELHSTRFNAARLECFGISNELNLAEYITVPSQFCTGRFRCRLLYSAEIEHVEFSDYVGKQINSLKMVTNNSIDYHLKFANRTELENLYSQKGSADDIVIVKNGCLTDSYAANLVFFDGSTWFTPSTPLLAGTQRQNLLSTGLIREARITTTNFRTYKFAGLINAFNTLQDIKPIPVQNISF